MATGGRIRTLLRWVLLGRRDRLRARVRRKVGVFTFVDEPRSGDVPSPAASAPAPAPATEGPSDLAGWTAVASLDDLPEGEVIEAMVGERALAVARVGDEVYALDNVCPHAGGPLGDGSLEGCELTCPWHGWTFDVTTGQCAMDPSMQAGTVEAKVHEGHVYVRA